MSKIQHNAATVFHRLTDMRSTLEAEDKHTKLYTL